jgi:hypothetical protein
MKNCLECTEKNVGREDKKFCSDGCRNAYNNKINKDSNNYMRNTNNKLRKIIVFYQNLILKENQNNPSKIIKQGFWFWIFTNILKLKQEIPTIFLYDQGYMLLDNDFYILVKRHLSPPPISQYEKSFPHFCRYFYYSFSNTLFLPWCPSGHQTTAFCFRIFNWKSIRKVKQFRNNRTMLVLKITIRLLVIYKKLQKLGLQTSIQKAILWPNGKFSQVTEYFG